MDQILAACSKRRATLLKQLAPNSLVLIAGSQEMVRNHDVHYPFRQNSDFYYLTGFDEPNAVALLSNHPQLPEFVLFVNPKDPAAETWTGIRAGVDGAKIIYSASEAYAISEFERLLPDLMGQCSNYYYSFGLNRKFDHKVLKLLNKVRGMQRLGVNLPEAIIPLDKLLAKMRLIKDELEIKLMSYAAQKSAEAHVVAMQQVKKLKTEYQMYGLIMQQFLAHEMVEAYGSIIGCGRNSCILHYTQNNQPLHEKELLLIDAGGEYKKYASDITRTFPVSGKFSKEQAAIYNLVLRAQLAAIAEVKPGTRWDAMQNIIVKIISEGLLELGVIQDLEQYSTFYMHKSGHWVGLDVHDAGSYKIDGEWIKLQPNMVLTVEPGIYIAPNDDVDKKWWNIGIRIEDDILVTAEGNRNLSAAAPKEINEIEKLING